MGKTGGFRDIILIIIKSKLRLQRILRLSRRILYFCAMFRRIAFLLLLSTQGFSQSKINTFLTQDSVYNPLRTKVIAGTVAVSYAGLMVSLDQAWYANYPRSSFHFFNDIQEWQQMDKVGHCWSSYIFGVAGIDLMKWAGNRPNVAAIAGGSLGFLFESTVEILDGFSAGWGFSPPDIVANTTGALMAISQQLAWKEQRVMMKFSFHLENYPTDAQNARSSELYGRTFIEKLLKDYNGQAYWLSVNVGSFLPANSWFPKWLCISPGYGAGNMFSAFSNQVTRNGETTTDFNVYPRYRQFYLSLDVDLRKIKTRSHILKTVFAMVNVLKFPAPTLEFNTLGEIKFHPIYY